MHLHTIHNTYRNCATYCHIPHDTAHASTTTSCIYVNETAVYLVTKYSNFIYYYIYSCNMKVFVFIVATLYICILAECKDYDPNLLKCLVCRATMKEIEAEIAKIDPSKEIEIGNYRLDALGNIIHKKIPLAQSEVYISDMLDGICDKMSDYVKATYKSNGQLTILNLLSPSGGMNPEMSKVDIIQDGDLNKNLKYNCESIVEEYEDAIIPLLISKQSNVKRKLCTDISSLCDSNDFPHEEEDIVDSNEESSIDEDHDEF